MKMLKLLISGILGSLLKFHSSVSRSRSVSEANNFDSLERNFCSRVTVLWSHWQWSTGPGIPSLSTSKGRGNSVGRESDRTARRNNDAGSSPHSGTGFFSQSAISADPLTVSEQPPCAIACINVCANGKKPKYWQR